MPAKKSLSHLDCVVAETVDIIGDRWTLLIMRNVFMGVRRFDDFQSDLQISRNVLTDRLQRLVADDVLTTVPYQDNPPRHEYRLTDKGRDLLDLLLAVWRFGDKWTHTASTRRLVHKDCGQTTHMVPACINCGGELTRHNLLIEPPLDVVVKRQQAAETVR